jgi:exosortase
MALVREGAVESTAVEPRVTRATAISVSLYVGLALVVGLLVWTYWPVLPALVRQWRDEDQYSHGFLVPFISLGLVWYNRERLRTLPIRRAYTGLPIMLFAVAVYVTGIVGADLFLQRTSMIVMIAGATLFVTGWTMFRALAFPLSYLLLMIPLPGIIFNSIAFPLQLLAAQIAASVMQLFGVPVLREGNVMHLASTSLDVEEACSGIRSLISLTALGVIYAYVTESKFLPRLLFILLIVPIAIVANVFRVTITGLLAHYVSPDTAIGLFHEVGGLFVFLLAVTLLVSASRMFKLFRILR